MSDTDPSAADEPRDRINCALGILSERHRCTVTGALFLLHGWAHQVEMTVADVADLVLAEWEVRASTWS
ncbi:hypothetical protein [Actinomycetospora sp. TBRC 11914]|uniref:hypothetical protein n=1 Tax=Actinomycetospora sp. TBRC 11914 TaxID=2729387 RepID=UPI00145F5D32|nr:hypothetical protein [Actinomycetospora sp. TBRC 11914]NMO90596.1 hypothetical protein [Actinomycetospora sp. TBRC 11914]